MKAITRVVVADPPGDAAEEGERPGVPLEERLGALAREGGDEDRVGVRQGHDEEGHRRRLAVEGHLGLAEVDLGLAGRVGQRDEDLGGPEPVGGDGLLHDGQAALIAVLVAEPLEDPPGGVPLLPGGLLVGLEDLVDDRQQGIELGPGSGCRAAVAGRLGVVEDLGERVPVDGELAADRATRSGRRQRTRRWMSAGFSMSVYTRQNLTARDLDGRRKPPSWPATREGCHGRHVF